MVSTISRSVQLQVKNPKEINPPTFKKSFNTVGDMRGLGGEGGTEVITPPYWNILETTTSH